MHRRVSFDRPSKFFQLGGQRLQLRDQYLGVDFSEVGRSIEQGVQHHCDAGQNRLFDPLKRLLEARLLLLDFPHVRKHGPARVKKM